jgi:hypothetical protein
MKGLKLKVQPNPWKEYNGSHPPLFWQQKPQNDKAEAFNFKPNKTWARLSSILKTKYDRWRGTSSSSSNKKTHSENKNKQNPFQFHAHYEAPWMATSYSSFTGKPKLSIFPNFSFFFLSVFINLWLKMWQFVGMGIYSFLVVCFYTFLGLFLGNRTAEITLTSIFSFMVIY